MKDQLFYMDDSYINEAGFVAMMTKDIREKEKNTSLDPTILEQNGFKKIVDEITNMISFEKEVKKKHDNYHFFIAVRQLSNYPGRHWWVRIDNCDMDSVASLDIETVRHFNKLMRLMDIDFTINI